MKEDKEMMEGWTYRLRREDGEVEDEGMTTGGKGGLKDEWMDRNVGTNGGMEQSLE